MVSRDGMEVSGDSIMGLMMLGAACGTSIEVWVEGAEAEALAAALRELVAGRFGEPVVTGVASSGCRGHGDPRAARPTTMATCAQALVAATLKLIEEQGAAGVHARRGGAGGGGKRRGALPALPRPRRVDRGGGARRAS